MRFYSQQFINFNGIYPVEKKLLKKSQLQRTLVRWHSTKNKISSVFNKKFS